jgi:hypothetical protein
MGMLFSDGKSDADVFREAAYRSEHIHQRIDELTAAIGELKRDGRAELVVEADRVSLQGCGKTVVHLGLLADTARPFFRAALDEALRLKNEIDAKLAAARKVLEA